MTGLDAIVLACTALLTALLVKGLPWVRAILADRRARVELAIEERRLDREDAGRFLAAVQGESKEARATLQAWFLDVRAQLTECRVESQRLSAEMVELRAAHSDCERRQRKQQNEVDDLKRQLEAIRSTLVRDYARRPGSIIPAGDAETPISDRPRKG